MQRRGFARLRFQKVAGARSRTWRGTEMDERNVQGGGSEVYEGKGERRRRGSLLKKKKLDESQTGEDRHNRGE